MVTNIAYYLDILLKNIAYDLYFDGIYYFYRLFRKMTGASPNRYKEKSQGYFRLAGM
jgi:YesN/AraC family two-component response regulator